MLNLTDTEKRDIVKYIEEGKELPEKYRFLLFESKRQVDLSWNGKSNDVTNVVLPFQTIECVDEPRQEKRFESQEDLFDFSGRQIKGWTNKLIWGDNKYILSSLKNGPMREEIEENGGIKLIYIDPPFDVGADFTMNIDIGEETFEKTPNVLEQLAYRDTWGLGQDSFLSMIHERLLLMKDLLSDDGSIYVHCDWRVNSSLRLISDEVFGKENFKNEIIWKRRTGTASSNKGFGIQTDSILYYQKSNKSLFNAIFRKDISKEEIDNKFNLKDEKGRRYWSGDLGNPADRPNLKYVYKGYNPPKNGWAVSQSVMEKMDEEGRLIFPKKKTGRIRRKMFIDDWQGFPVQNLWDDIVNVQSQSKERLDYPTQKPEKLIERIINVSSKEGDIVCDFFVGSGTTSSVCEKLNRKWICSDLGKFSIHTTRKRLLSVQRELKKDGKDYRAFEILNLGKYQAQHFISEGKDERDENKKRLQSKKESEFISLILNAYKSEPVKGFKTFHGKKSNRMISIGPVNQPLSRLHVEEVIEECLDHKITKVDILGFEYEMGLFPTIQDEARGKGIDLSYKQIPIEVFDKRAVDRNEVIFHDVAYIEIKPIVKGNLVSIELIDFCVFYNQQSVSYVEGSLKNGKSKIVVDNGQIIKVIKDKDGIVKTEQLTKKWDDWIDYWSVDYDFESKQEIIRVAKEDNPDEYEEKWTGDFVFENEWQSFRTKDNRKLDLKSSQKEITKSKVKVAVKVIDIFGNDTMKVMEVKI